VKLPDLSYMMTVAGLRYIQSIYEPPERRSPDGLVGELLTPWQRMNLNLRARVSLGTACAAVLLLRAGADALLR